MAVSQSIVWTTLPYGRVTTPEGKPALRISLFVSPRLKPDATEKLGPFALFRDWPATVAKLQFKLSFEGGGGGDLKPMAGEDPLDSGLWKALFDANTFVRGHVFTDLQNTQIRSFSAATVLGYVQDLYGDTADKFGGDFVPHGPNDQTPLTGLKNDLGPINNPDYRGRFNNAIDGLLKKGKVVPSKVPGFASAAQAAFFQASRFYDRKKPPQIYAEKPDPKFKPVPVKEPEFDFHQALAAFADYPRFMRRLGIVIDCLWLETKAMPLTGRVRLQVTSSDAAIKAVVEKDKPGWTAYAMTRTGPMFRARAAAGVESELTRGILDLRLATDSRPDAQKGQYLIAQLDVDGSALKTVHTAGSLVRLDNKELTNYRSPKKSDLPALRTSGLSLYKRDRAIATHQQLVRAATLQTAQVGPAVTLPGYFADDLLRGYRIDVWDDISKDWHPLCLRNGEYTLTKRNKQQLTLRDEGYVKGASASRGANGTDPDMYQHERLTSFDGWSLVASRPGKTLAADPSEAAPVPPPESAQTEFGLETRFSPPAGTVPRLRFGRNYKLRVRLVDIAGNSIDMKEAGEEYASPGFLFTRFEPVPSPTLVPRVRYTEGESLERLVIRSDYDRSVGAYATDASVKRALEQVCDRLKLKGKARDGYAYSDGNERHVAPPKTSQLEAETHGKFDEFIGPGKDHAKGFRLASREKGTLLSKTIVSLATGAETPIAGLDLEVIPSTAPGSLGVPPTNLDAPGRLPGDPLAQGEYVLHKEEELVIPYLPDPFAVGVAFLGLPGYPAGATLIVPLDGNWPDVKPFRIRLIERPGVLNQCSQVFADAGEPQWGLAPGGSGERVLTLFQPKGVVTEVRYSSVLPDEKAAQNMGLWKWLEQRGGLTASTRKAILASKNWLFTPWRTLTLVHAVQHPLCAPTIKTWAPSREIGNTFAHLRGHWYLSAKSTSKVLIKAAWMEPLDDVAKPAPQILDRTANVAEIKIDPAFPDELDVPVASNIPALKGKGGILHEFGDTKHRWIQYRLKGTTSFREYFPVEITHEDAAITRQGTQMLISIPSSARPVAAAPLYVLPTFRWEETTLPNNGLSRTRKGNGVRVYLERPWWSSGDDERLGVVFRPGTVDDKDKALVTQWGLDPAFDSAAPAAGPTLSSFPLASETRPNISLEEKGNASDVYSVAGHLVEFDPERKLWFSDITVAMGGSYFPFLRLALARFQPFSIEDCHLSRVVLTDFIQLAPDRTLKMTWITASKVRIQIYGPAPTETYVSRLLGQWVPASTGTQVKSATLPIADIVKSPSTGAKAFEFFKAGQLEFFQADKVGIDPGILTIPADPAEPSSRFGLNEYSVTMERLPADESPDFGWEAIDGVTPTKPPSGGAASSLAKIDLPAAVSRSSAAATPITKKATRATKAASASSSAKAASAAGKLTAAIELGPILELKPLWEGDVAIPTSNDNRPRRLVIKEHELYFKATPQPGDPFIPIARRLVYVDILALPGPAA